MLFPVLNVTDSLTETRTLCWLIVLVVLCFIFVIVSYFCVMQEPFSPDSINHIYMSFHLYRTTACSKL